LKVKKIRSILTAARPIYLNSVSPEIAEQIKLLTEALKSVDVYETGCLTDQIKKLRENSRKS